LAMDMRPCEFFLVRYVPDPVKNEFVNIGVLLREAADGRRGEAAVRFTRNWGRVRCIDPDADTETLEAFEVEVRQRLAQPAGDAKPVLAQLEDSLSVNLQLTSAQGCLAENLAAKMDQLMQLYVEPRKREAVSRKSTRQSIYAAMRRSFEQAGVWPFVKTHIQVAKYTQRADTLRIDFSYKNGGMRMFQAMPLENIDAAKVLAFTAPALAKGVREKHSVELELTAIGERLIRNKADGGLEKNDDQLALYESGKKILEDAGIHFRTTADLPGIANRAREDLRV